MINIRKFNSSPPRIDPASFSIWLPPDPTTWSLNKGTFNETLTPVVWYGSSSVYNPDKGFTFDGNTVLRLDGYTIPVKHTVGCWLSYGNRGYQSAFTVGGAFNSDTGSTSGENNIGSGQFAIVEKVLDISVWNLRTNGSSIPYIPDSSYAPQNTMFIWL